MKIFVGTAGWAVPKQHGPLFSRAAASAQTDSALVESGLVESGLDEPGLVHSGPAGGPKPSQLRQFASRLGCVEINSSFHRPHRRSTWERWAADTPAGFRFAVKAPKAVTHTAALVNCGAALVAFFAAVRGLGEKLGPVLFQLPPKLSFDEGVAREFFTTLRELHEGQAVLEPRHASWFSAPAHRLLESFHIARVAADPPKGSPLAAEPGGWPGLRYWRLHGAPHTYYSNYDDPWLSGFAKQLNALDGQAAGREGWVIFDNTAQGHATVNAISLDEALRRP